MLSKLGLPNISKSSVIDSLICRLKMFSKSTSLIVLYAGHLKKKALVYEPTLHISPVNL